MNTGDHDEKASVRTRTMIKRKPPMEPRTVVNPPNMTATQQAHLRQNIHTCRAESQERSRDVVHK